MPTHHCFAHKPTHNHLLRVPAHLPASLTNLPPPLMHITVSRHMRILVPYAHPASVLWPAGAALPLAPRAPYLTTHRAPASPHVRRALHQALTRALQPCPVPSRTRTLTAGLPLAPLLIGHPRPVITLACPPLAGWPRPMRAPHLHHQCGTEKERREERTQAGGEQPLLRATLHRAFHRKPPVVPPHPLATPSPVPPCHPLMCMSIPAGLCITQLLPLPSCATFAHAPNAQQPLVRMPTRGHIPSSAQPWRLRLSRATPHDVISCVHVHARLPPPSLSRAFSLPSLSCASPPDRRLSRALAYPAPLAPKSTRHHLARAAAAISRTHAPTPSPVHVFPPSGPCRIPSCMHSRLPPFPASTLRLPPSFVHKPTTFSHMHTNLHPSVPLHPLLHPPAHCHLLHVLA
ncbi:hypothetical protein EVG20_g10044 [Dentipellis fragilis]|uniref:Uncharacterized protein n=1 Tax=Dentipellis fragilis TaxID=205917 RepID=A0A4Y9XTK5_9AGAM|nr:hypothetical protein EVG20_g10044 [Dentipellis fragilis]